MPLTILPNKGIEPLNSWRQKVLLPCDEEEFVAEWVVGDVAEDDLALVELREVGDQCDAHAVLNEADNGVVFFNFVFNVRHHFSLLKDTVNQRAQAAFLRKHDEVVRSNVT